MHNDMVSVSFAYKILSKCFKQTVFVIKFFIVQLFTENFSGLDVMPSGAPLQNPEVISCILLKLKLTLTKFDVNVALGQISQHGSNRI